MTKRFTSFTLAAALSVLPAVAFANTLTGRVTNFSPTSISVFDKEVVTVGLNGETVFTKLIAQKPWQESGTLPFSALHVGRDVVVHADNGVASWVQVATDRPVFVERAFTAFVPRSAVPTVFATEAARHRAEAAVLRAAPNASESKRPGSPGTALHSERIANRLEKAAGVIAAPADNLGTPAPVLQTSANDILSGKEVRELIANAKTPADHRKLAKHFASVSARDEAEAADHAAEAKTYRATPSASETKRPGGPDTALHCDRLAEAARNAATAARDLARDHEQMAK